MKGLLILVLIIGVSGLVYCKPEEKYTTKYDNIDLDAVLGNDRLLQRYFDCIMESKMCPKDAEELKKYIPDALQTGCSKCHDGQRKAAKKVIYFLIKEKRPYWDKLQQKFDPENSYVVKYAEELKKDGITL